MKKPERKAFTFNVPVEEAQAMVLEANRLGISITMLFRMWIREMLMSDPIKITEKV